MPIDGPRAPDRRRTDERAAQAEHPQGQVAAGARLEQELPGREALLRELTENIHQVFWLASLDQRRIFYVSPSYEDIWGLSCESLLRGPKSWLQAVHPEDRPGVEAKAGRGRGGRFTDEYRIVRPDGAVRWILARGYPVRDKRGRPYRIAGLAEDITERKRLEQALQESELRYRSLFENMVEGFAYCRMLFEDGRPQGVIFLEVNRAFEELTGLRNVAGRKGSELPPGFREADPEWLERIGRVAMTGQPERFEYYFNELKMWFSISAYCPKKEHLILLFDNISQRKLAEAELHRSRGALRALTAQMESAREEERARLAREIHDELGHTTADLKLDLAWLARRLAEAGITGRSAIRKRIAAMSRRAEADAQTVRRIATDLRPAVLDTLGLAAAVEWQGREFQERTRIRCEIEATGVLPRVDGLKSTAVFRIFQEALSNVARHAQASQVRVRLAAEPGRLVLRVCDNGRGMTEAEQSSPTALGLLGVRERVAALGGDIAIASAPGRGTTITVSLPVGPA
jgi:PAS domain S-box-containing protein